MKMVLVMNLVPVEVSTSKRPSSRVHHGHFLAQVEGRREGLDLLQQVVGQFLAGADGHGRDVVDGLVRIQLHALAANYRQRIDHVRLDFQQAEFEHLEQADRAGADDDGVGIDDAVDCRSLDIVFHDFLDIPVSVDQISRAAFPSCAGRWLAAGPLAGEAR
jgi:hypothetical protein